MSADVRWFHCSPTGEAILHLHIQPGAKKTEIVGLHGEALKIRLAAPPVDGKANSALCRFLADRLGLPLAAVTVKSGLSSRQKTIVLSGVTPSALAALLPPT